jgi:hypothetical protein
MSSTSTRARDTRRCIGLDVHRDLPPTSRLCLGTSRGVNEPARSRGTFSGIEPTSVHTVFGVVPLRELPEPAPAGVSNLLCKGCGLILVSGWWAVIGREHP